MGGKVHDQGCPKAQRFGALMSFHDARTWVEDSLAEVIGFIDAGQDLPTVLANVKKLKRDLFW
jgi:hypothetical protein